MRICCCREVFLFDRRYAAKSLLVKQHLYSRLYIWNYWRTVIVPIMLTKNYFRSSRCSHSVYWIPVTQVYHCSYDWRHLYGWGRSMCLATCHNCSWLRAAAMWYVWSQYTGVMLHCVHGHKLFWSQLRCTPMELLPASYYMFINGVRAWNNTSSLLDKILDKIVGQVRHHSSTTSQSTSFTGATIWTTSSSTFIYAYVHLRLRLQLQLLHPSTTTSTTVLL